MTSKNREKKNTGIHISCNFTFAHKNAGNKLERKEEETDEVDD